MHSFRDSKDKLWVACSECNRGGNGNGEDKCACGWKSKKFNGLGCFCGTLLLKLGPIPEKTDDDRWDDYHCMIGG